jgi:tRNA threonylcarbamoyladenosine biosynthesis protein TsaB
MWLAIDTATDRASVALGALGAAPLEETVAGARRQAAALLPAIEALLHRAGATLDGLEGVALSDGPGSFTGLRVGASVAKALVHARRVPLWTAPSLMVRAAGIVRDDRPVLSIANALRGDVYAAVYRFSPDRIDTDLPPSVRRPAELRSAGFMPAAIVGEAPAEILTELEAWAGCAVIGPPEGSPRAADLLALIGRTGGARPVNAPGTWEPEYGRPAEAQARWEMAHGRPLSDSVGSSR